MIIESQAIVSRMIDDLATLMEAAAIGGGINWLMLMILLRLELAPSHMNHACMLLKPFLPVLYRLK